MRTLVSSLHSVCEHAFNNRKLQALTFLLEVSTCIYFLAVWAECLGVFPVMPWSLPGPPGLRPPLRPYNSPVLPEMLKAWPLCQAKGTQFSRRPREDGCILWKHFLLVLHLSSLFRLTRNGRSFLHLLHPPSAERKASQ